VTRKQAARSGLVAAGALALGIWLGVSAGLATRAKHGSTAARH
jgi:hypothetical protein